ncbi:MAG: gamma-glutamyltransferase [Bryobacteraceae bacterium]
MRRATLLILLAAMAFSRDRNQSRFIVYNRHGVISTSHALATQAGVRVLERGGSAVDAAIAANAVLSVAEPMMCGPGGDFFLIHREARTSPARPRMGGSHETLLRQFVSCVTQ